MCNAFSQNNHEVELIVNSRASGIDVNPEEYYKLRFEFNLTKVWVPDIVSWGPFFFMVCTFIFTINSYRVLRRQTYDLVYCRHEWILFILSFFIPVDKMVYESHEAKLTLPARSILKRGIRCVVISEGIRDEYLKQGFLSGQFLIAHDGIDESFFSEVESKQNARKRLNLPLDGKIVMYIGGFDKWKGVETFFDSTKYNEDLHYVVIGGRQEQIDIYGKKYPNINFLGSRPYSELKDNQQASDILVIPNTTKNKLSSSYTSPLKLFAHMSSGVPIVASNVPSISIVAGPEFITFVEADNPEALAKGFVSIFKNYSIKVQAAEDLVSISHDYTWKKRAANLLSFIS
jgi:glycosyltransferase involved in cell wall biosynthesis